MAKIKKRYHHDTTSRHRHKPNRISKPAFERVYWPYLPLIAAICLLMGLVVRSGPVGNLLTHPGGRVLSYATSTSLDGLLSDTNTTRVQNNQAPLKLNAQLDTAAQAKANDMATRDYWSHNTPDGLAPWTFVTNANYNYQKLGENLATGFSDDQSVINAWLASPAHRENLLDPSYSDVGFGFANVPNYIAAGGGPMTVVVAFYGEPPVTATGISVVSSSGAQGANTNSPTSGGQALGNQTSRLQLAIAGSRAANWSSAIIAVAIAGVAGIWVGRHYVKIKRSLRKGERYALSHPLMDAGLLVVILLLLALSQTIGLIK